jgi:hypothetical protein
MRRILLSIYALAMWALGSAALVLISTLSVSPGIINIGLAISGASLVVTVILLLLGKRSPALIVAGIPLLCVAGLFVVVDLVN